MKTPDLRSQPEIAQEIGLLMMYAANLEIMFISIVTELMGGNKDIPSIIALQVDNLSAKIGIMFEIANLKRGAPFANVVLEAKEPVQKAIAFRNKLAHSLYVFDDATGAFELFSNLLSIRRGKPKCEPLKTSVIAKHREALREAIDMIIQAGDDRLWNPLEVP
jgi:hypothetical protein